MMKSLLIVTALAISAGCAGRLPDPGGKSIPINSLATAEMLSHDAGLMIVGKRRDDKDARRELLFEVPDGVPVIETRQWDRAVPVEALVAMPVPRRVAGGTEMGIELIEKTVVVPFDFDSVVFRPTPEQQYRIRQLAAVADRIEVRGRTDGVGPREADRFIAKARAEAAQRYLVGRGVPNDIIAVSYQAAGDYVDDHAERTGRAKTRRVEIEFYVDHFIRQQENDS